MLLKNQAFEQIFTKSLKLFKSYNNIIFIGILAILPFLIISFFNNPSADDFCFNANNQDFGYLGANLYSYNNYNGRFFSAAILNLNSLVSGSFIIYKLTPIILFSSLFLSIYYLSSLLFYNFKRRDLIILSLLCLVVYLIQMPSVSQGFYWLAGSITYQLPNILTVIFFCLLIKLFKANKRKYIALLTLSSIFIIGSNETSMILIDFLISSVFIYRWVQDKKINKSILLILLFAILFSMVVIISPGNSARSSYFSNNHQFFDSIINSFLAYKKYIIHWLPLIILIILIFYNYFAKKISNNTSKIFIVNPIIVFIIVFSIPLIGFFPGYWGLGSRPPLRTINTIYFFFLIGIIYFSFVLFFNLNKHNNYFINFSEWVKYLLFILVFIRLTETNNIKVAYSDLITGKAYQYDLELKRRYQLIGDSKIDTVFVPKLRYIPATIYFDDITNDTKDWRNQCHDSYYKSKTILLRTK